MRYLIIALFLVGNLYAQTPIEEFDKVMDAYNEAYTSAETEAEREAINTKYDVLIGEAEKVFENAIELEFQAEEAKLEAEFEASEKELKALESVKDEIVEETETVEVVDVVEVIEVIEVTKSANLLMFEGYLLDGRDYLYIYNKFNKTSLISIATEVGASTSGYKKDIALSIQNKLK